MQKSPKTVYLSEVPGRPLRNGLHCRYLAFVNVEDAEASSQSLKVGQFLHVSWVEPDPDTDSSPRGWKAQVLPPLPDVATPGNLLLIIYRTNVDKRSLVTNDQISNDMKAAAGPLWLLPTPSALSAKRLINALNLVHDGDSPKHKVLRRILRAMTFNHIEMSKSLLALDSYQSHADEIGLLRSALSASQEAVWERILKTSTFMEFITGPFGTGKTTFIVFLTRALVILGKKVLLCCSSSAAVDTLAKKLTKLLRTFERFAIIACPQRQTLSPPRLNVVDKLSLKLGPLQLQRMCNLFTLTHQPNKVRTWIQM